MQTRKAVPKTNANQVNIFSHFLRYPYQENWTASRPYESIPKSNEFLENENNKKIHKNSLTQRKMMQKQREKKTHSNKATCTQTYIKQAVKLFSISYLS